MDGQDKINMSLDEIIKLNRKEKRNAVKQARGRGRGVANGNTTRGRGRQFTGRGRGRGQIRTDAQSNNNNNIVSSQQGFSKPGLRGRGGISRGRATRGRGAQQAQTAAVSPLNRKPRLTTVRARGRGRQVQGQSRMTTFRNSNLKPARNATQAQRRQRLNMVKEQAVLLREKELAIHNLQTARKTMQDINKAIQKTARTNVVNNKRGIVVPTGPAPTRGAGRGKLLTGLMRQNVKAAGLVSRSASRQMMDTSVTITNQAATTTNTRRRRQWRANKSDVTIQVANSQRQSNKPSPPKPSIMEQLKLLKPSVSTTYKFQKNVFASSTTNVSLNDRFSSTPSGVAPSSDNLIEGRKVFI